MENAAEREELRRRLAGWTDAPLTALALVMLALLIVELASIVPPGWSARIEQVQVAIWAVFAAAFAAELALAPAKRRYLRENWLTAVSVLLPAIRAVRVLRVARVLRGARLVRIIAALNGGTRALQQIASAAHYAYVALLTTMVAVTAAAATFYFERDVVASGVRTFGDALWWSATTITTVNAGPEPVTFEGRSIALLLRLFALGVSGYITATVAVYLLGGRPQHTEIARLTGEIEQLRRSIETATGAPRER